MFERTLRCGWVINGSALGVPGCSTGKEIAMLNWAVIFLIIAVVAAIFGFSGVAGAAANIAWILAVVGIILAIAFFVMGRRPPLP